MIGREVKRRRAELGLTGAQLAGRAGLAPSAVSQIETGKRTPNSASVIKLATALGTEVGDLYPKGQAPLPDFEDERRASLRSWIDFAGRLAGRWAGEIEEREAAKKHVMMLPNLHWAVEIMSTYTDVVEAVATDPNYDAWVYGREVYGREEVRELYAATRRMREAVDRTKDWFPSGQEDPKMAEVIDLRRAAIERAEKRLGARAS